MKSKNILKLFVSTSCIMLLLACNKNEEEAEPVQPSSPNKVLSIDVVLGSRDLPWGLAVFSNGDLLFTERPGRLFLLNKGASQPTLLATRNVQQNGEGGLLGLAIDPDHETNHFVYAYETASDNRVVRYKLENNVLTEDKVIVAGIPKAGNHDGGVIQFGPDGFLYIGTGDAQVPSNSQNRSSLAGKILRVDRDGNPAPGNPFGTLLYSYGHRNVQGITWAGNGQMYATEHGPSGDLGWCCHDELNRIEAGKNYGWPLAHAGSEKDSLTAPIAESGEDTWAPSGCLFTGESAGWSNKIAVACLRGKRVELFSLSADGAQVTSHSDTLFEKFGRIRNIVKGLDGSLLFCTSNGSGDQILSLSRK